MGGFPVFVQICRTTSVSNIINVNMLKYNKLYTSKTVILFTIVQDKTHCFTLPGQQWRERAFFNSLIFL